ncbi:RNA polymerase factor sigma-54 [Lacibacterium aquatile]|uniref:RNA polymerase sigma-54 factor n=1 Tax=Lacibacterium aquatile TaxID=1168082 RepID=A0ABW5DQH2_9PROT
MALAPRLDLRQAQSLVMTPQLQQAIKLLQLSNLELTAYVESELERNPLLERDEGSEAAAPVEAEGRDTAEFAASDDLPASGEAPLDYDGYRAETTAPTADDGTDLGLVEAGMSSWEGGGSGGGRGDFEDDDRSLDERFGEVQSLRDHLVAQAQIDISDPGDRLIAWTLIDLLDESGYLIANLDDVAAQLGTNVARVERVLAMLQRLDPPGVAARSLKECLGLQLADRNRLDPAMQALLDNLPMLAARDIPGLLKVCGIDSEDLSDMIREIRALDPKPGLAFAGGTAEPVTPDILMRPLPDGSYFIELNPDTLPRVLINSRYYARVRKSALDRDAKDYLSEQLQSANWLVKALHQRATTVIKVASEIVRQQELFFDKGVQHLRPLILRDIAEAIGMHESTVSRVTTNKFMTTPRGLFELKYFFTSAIQSSEGGAAHSAEAVRYMIKRLIDAESPTEILSDDKIVEILLKDGIDIARRTVAKYRESMKISSSVQRRREKSFKI